jgi:amino acid transporter
MAAAKKFGTFTGVFTPSVLTILGVIMYLRLPWIAGQGGLVATIGIILLAHTISVTTGLSVSSVATDKKVKAGGTYYVISRSLGLPIGGALGLALFVALSFSVSLYVIGFSESFLAIWGIEVTLDTIRLVGTITLLVVTTVSFISTALALKTQFYILAAIGLSLLSITLGHHELGPDVVTTAAATTTAIPFIVLFGIFFPAVTGFEAGVSMSGDLKDPKKSIPVGTISAILVGLTVYIALAIFLARTVSADALRNNPRVLLDISLFPPLVIAGIWGATISSAFGSILGAPRILQATAADRITPRFFAHGHGKENEPRRAMMITFAIAEAGILIGELDVIARIVSMFFITAYGFLNLSAAIESWVSPDFRPDFRVPTAIPIVGAIACFVVMIQLDFVAMIGSTVVLGAVYLYLTRRQLTLESGDTWEGMWSSVTRSALRRLSSTVQHRRNWRPNILQFGAPEREPHLLEFARTLVAKRGMLTNVQILPATSDLPRCATPPVTTQTEGEAAGVFFRTVEYPDRNDGIVTVASLYGFSGIEPNTVMLGWQGDAANDEAYVSLLRRLAAMDHNLLLLNTGTRGFGDRANVDVWWMGASRNIGLAIALVRFLSASDDWPLQQIRFLVANDGDASSNETIARSLRALLKGHRVDGTIRVISNGLEQRPIDRLMAEESSESDLTIFALPDRLRSVSAQALRDTEKMVDVVGTALLIQASSFFPDISVMPRARTAPVALASPGLGETGAASRLEMPRASELAAPILAANDSLRSVTDQWCDRFVDAVLQEYAALIEEVSSAIDTTFEKLRECIDSPDRHRRLRGLARAKSGFWFYAAEMLETFANERLLLQQEQMAELSPWLREEIARALSGMPEVIRVDVASETGVQVKRLRRRSRRVRFRRSASALVPERCQDLALESLRSCDHAARSTLEGMQRLFRSMGDGVARIEAGMRDADKMSLEMIDVESSRISQSIESVRNGVALTRRDMRGMLHARTDELVSVLARATDGVGLGNPNRLERRRRGEALGALEELAKGWQDARRLEINGASLVVRLTSFRDRLDTIVTRGTDELLLDVANNFVDPLSETAAAIDQLSKQQSTERRKSIVYGGKERFAGDTIVETFLEEIETAIGELPEEVELLADAGDTDGTDMEPLVLPLRQSVQFLVEVEFAGPLRDEIGRAAPCVDAAANVAEDVVRLTSFRLDDGSAAPAHEGNSSSKGTDAIVRSAVERLTEARHEVETCRDELRSFISKQLRGIGDELHTVAVLRAAAQLGRHEREKKGREVLYKVTALWKQGGAALRQRLVRLQYRGSEGVLLARRLGLSGARTADDLSRLRNFIDSVLPSQVVLDQIPSYYKQLFLGKPAALPGGRGPELAEADELVTRHGEGAAGGLAIIGPPRSGQTMLAQMIARRALHRGNMFQLHPPPGGSSDPDVFRQHLSVCLGREGDTRVERALQALPKESVFIFHDLELWWERAEGGGTVIEAMADLIGTYGRQHLFILSTVDRTFNFIDRLYGLQEHLLGVVGCRAFDAEDLKAAILNRHESTGLIYTLDGLTETELSEWAVAKLFTAFFRYTGGNVGDALNAWISHADAFQGTTITLRRPETPDSEALDGLRPIQTALVVQWILHRRLTRQRLERVTALGPQELHAEVGALLRTGLLVDRGGGVLELNPFIEPHLIKRFSEVQHV